MSIADRARKTPTMPTTTNLTFFRQQALGPAFIESTNKHYTNMKHNLDAASLKNMTVEQ
jgi:hypothetical protein